MRVLITPTPSWWRIDWRELWQYRDLLWHLVLRDLTAIYKQSVLGPAWFVIQPVATTIVFTVIFGRIAQISTDGLPPFLFYMGGMVVWNYFQLSLDAAAGSFIKNAQIFEKVYFPRLILPLAAVVTNLAQLALNTTLFAGLILYFTFFTTAAPEPSRLLIALPLLILQAAGAALGLGLCLSAMTAKYRDLRFALPFLSQLLLYATPVVYPASAVPPSMVWLLRLNPMSSVVELHRRAFLGRGTVDPEIIAWNVGMAVFLLIAGLLLHNRVQRTFVDTI